MTATRVPPTAPHWLRDIDATLPITGQYVLHGNLRDVHDIPDVGRPLNTMAALWWLLRRSGFDYLLRHDAVGGLQLVNDDTDPESVTRAAGAVSEVLSGSAARLGQRVSPDAMTDALQRVARHRQWRGALAFDYISQQRVDQEPLPEDLRRLMLAALAETHIAAAHPHDGPRPTALPNCRFWLVDRLADLPSWMVGGADGIRQLPIPLPDLDTRMRLADKLAPSLPQFPNEAPDRASVIATFANSSEGMTLRAMVQTTQLARDSSTPARDVEDAVRAHRVGLLDNKWKQEDLRTRILGAEETLGAIVLGQERAIRHVADILIRTTLGLTSAHLSGGSSGPRGVLFFAGPTGVGKTELAKRMTELIFGDERAYIRFDMSEFAAEHTEARLIGSPPGYVGYGSGGELTNAVRQRPFSVVLFDEIEKAHPKILDKFLQILSDGRLTDGSGATVHFGETVIVFTSNLGVAEAERRLREDPQGADYRAVMTDVIVEEFTDPQRFNRPELLGRIGDNLVIFERLHAGVAVSLAERFIDNVVERVLKERGTRVLVPQAVRDQMVAACTEDVSTGGRGIGMRVESLVTNPLARALAAHGPREEVTIVDIGTSHGEANLVLA